MIQPTIRGHVIIRVVLVQVTFTEIIWEMPVIFRIFLFFHTSCARYSPLFLRIIMVLIYIFNTDSVHLISMSNPLIVCVFYGVMKCTTLND